jgi:hypothetical protein
MQRAHLFMNPYPLFTLNHFTVPVTLVAKRKPLKHYGYNYMKSYALIKKLQVTKI